ncbi:hypothetical protein [Burkholderia ubonensis]|uniref:hypothetical protein n=1 Tax=Burkholderia ubonensis TaxID=101571 RepID=UPI000A98E193|nr:hypothetical protein [Burkholderia ubonensis]
MTRDVINHAGARTPFSADRLTGTLVREGVSVSDALAYAHAVEAFIATQRNAYVSTDQLRKLVTHLHGSLRPGSTGAIHGITLHTEHQRLHHDLSGVLPVRFEPPLKGISEQPGPFLKRSDISPGRQVNFMPPESYLERAKGAVMVSDKVRPFLEGKNFGLICFGFARNPADLKKEPPSIHMTIYNYTDDIALDIIFNVHNFFVTSVKEEKYQPPLSPQELEHAIAVTKRHPKITEWLTRDVVPNAILVTNQGEDSYRQHRLVLVLWRAEDEPSSRYWALVDLSRDVVRDIGKTAKEGGRSS